MTDFLLLAFIFLTAGIAMVPIASKLKLGSVLGYLIAGIAISPLLSLLHVDVVSIQHFAEFGVVMMLFLVGLELQPHMLWSMRHRLLGLGGMQVGLTALVVAVVAYLLGQGWTVALAIGLIFALSSTAIVLQTLNEKGLLRGDGGQASFSVLLFQDIAVIPMLALMPLLAMPELMDAGIAIEMGDHGASKADHGSSISLVDGLPGWQATLITMAAIAFVVICGSQLTGPLFRFIAMANLRELFVATALMMVVGIALLMTLVGLSPALGTFVAGVVLANSEYRHELESDIDPFRGLLLGLFFITVGAGINFALLAEDFVAIVSLTLGLIALKVLILYVLGVKFNLRGSDRWLFALSLAQAGEFGFVLLSYAVGISVIPASLSEHLLLIVALSMLLTPLLFLLYDKVIAHRYSKVAEREADAIDVKGKVIIAGHGRVGGIVNRLVRSSGYETTVIDYSSEQLEVLRAFGIRVYFGDATRPDLLHAAGIEEADIFVIAINNREQITELARHVVKYHPHVKVIARATTRHHVYDLWFVGVREIIRETFDSSVRMGRTVLENLGHSFDEASIMANAFTERDRKQMRELADLYDPTIPAHKNPAYVEKVKELNRAWEEEQVHAANTESSQSAAVTEA
ncbi:MAG: cation:proton antiporter [Proteobacteria bacterium]|nr:cation:proton antiporter [Pseudomonadota bacterium]MDA0929407.1 cation:proton antiporter [Pseudomonadota bacterium]